MSSAPEIHLRKAEAQDVDAVCNLWMSLMREHEALDARFVLSDDAMQRWKNDYPLWIEDRTRKVLIAELAGDVVGYIQAHRRLEPPIFQEKPEVFIDEIYVMPDARKKRVGVQLLEVVRQWSSQVGASHIRFRVLAANQEGIAFWEQQGAQSMYVNYTIELATDAEPVENLQKETRSRKLGF